MKHKLGLFLSLTLLGWGKIAAAYEPLDEHMILVMPTTVVTFDSSTVKINGGMRTARTHLYLSKPDEDRHISYQSIDEIDCVGKRHRYTNATGLQLDGKVDVVTADKPGFLPIVKDSIASVLSEYLCAIKNKPNYPRGGVMLEIPGSVSAPIAFALLKMGLDAEQAANLSGRSYGDQDALTYTLDEQKVEQGKRPKVIEALGVLVAEAAKPPPPIVPLDAAVKSGRVGQYVHSEMELGAGTWLKADGTFEYGLTVGSLDETARGRWTAAGDRILLSPGAMPAKRSDVNFGSWQVTSDSRTLSIVRDGNTMVFHRHGK